ncbi:DUF1430 domain-containing protein [Bacillus stercoris]|uniref:DUF1430 domain-containing protein n=1 Tax=Bacillus stercoris TaxID=2054641 RepID=UPI0026F9FC19|nr:DUF1430 domain-containing protein [Bacillus stercoris]MDO7346044.1 DUF1430 domain-containing protein [Bacillus stercoris]
MRKMICVLFFLFFISLNIFSYNFIVNKQIAYTLFSNKQVLIINYNKHNFNSEIFLKKLVDFSKKEKVNISQYNFLDEKTLNIYTSNIKDEPSLHIRDWKQPSKERYLSNFEKISEKNVMGSIKFPSSTWKIKYLDINQVNNVGIGNRFYISTTDNIITEKAIRQFSNFGDVSLESNNTINSYMFNTTLALLVLLSIIILFIGILYFAIKNRKQLILHKLWGYSKIKSLFFLPNLFLKPFVIIILFVALLIVILTFTFNLNDWIIIYAKLYILNIIIAILLLTGYKIMITTVLYNNSDISGATKGSMPFKKFQMLSLGFKLVITVLLFNVIALSFTNLFDLKQQLKNKSYWNKTQTIYKLNVTDTGIDYSNLKNDREKNDKLNKLYHELESHKNAFIMYADNYSVLERKGGKPIYFYTLNSTKENEVYSPSGRNVTISPNYLKINPIIGIKGKQITKKQLNLDPNTLNLLVPKKYAKFKEKIIKAYKEQFYFQKVEVENMYNKEIGHTSNALKKDRLKINIIYTENSQKYFTFNSELGDINKKNNIVDPIATIFTGNVDTSYIGAYATTSLFFYDDSEGMAYQKLVPYLEKTHTKNLINASVSVYKELSEQIARIQNMFIQNLIGSVIAIILSMAFLVSYIWTYYSVNAYNLYLKEIFGYSYWKRNKHLIIFSLTSNFLLGAGVSLYYNLNLLIIFIFLFIGLELIVLYIMSRYLNRKNMNKILKGDRI